MPTGFQHEHTHIMYAAETTWGTPVTVSKKIGTIKSFTPRKSWDVYEVQGAGDGREVQNYLKTRLNVGGTLAAELHEFEFLKHAVGPLAGLGTTASPYTITEADHTGVASSTDIIPFTLEVGSESTADDVDKYEGCHINTFTLDFTLGAPVMLTADFVAENVVSSTSATTYTALTTKPLMSTAMTFKWGQTPSALSSTPLRNVTITYNNNLKVFGDWSTMLILQPQTGKRRITWSATMVMTASAATALRDDFYGQANSPLTGASQSEFESNNEIEVAVDEGATSGLRRNYCYLDQCIIEEIQKPISIDNTDLVLVTFVGRAKTGGKTGSSNVFLTWWTVT